MKGGEKVSGATSCAMVCPHALRNRVLLAQLAHLSHKVSRVIHGLSSQDLSPALAVAVLQRSIAETLQMDSHAKAASVPE